MKNKRKKICIVSPSLKVGGIERALVVLSNYFVENGHNVYFISCLTNDKFYTLDYRIKLIEPLFRRKKGKADGILFYFRLILFLRREILNIKPDTVLTFGDWFSPLVLISLLKTGLPVFISDRTSPQDTFKFPNKLLKKLFYPKAKGFIAQSKIAADYKRKQFGNKLKIVIIPNALREVKLYNDIKREKVILYVGRLAWQKAPDRLIKVFSSVERRNKWEVYIAGTGPLLAEMKKLVNELRIDNVVKFLGNVEDVDKLFSKASIYVLPSIYEGFPNSLCEAMAAGLPCITFDTIPYKEIFEPDISGIVVSNETELREQLQELINNKHKRVNIGKKALDIREKLSIDKVGAKILEFILT